MQNPFYYGRVVEGSSFINRKQETRVISSNLERGQSVILFSPRRYGKTSLIKRVQKRLQRKKAVCFYIDLYPVTSLDSFYNVYSSAIAANLKTSVSSLVSLMASLMPMIKPKLVFSPGAGAPSVEIEADSSTLSKSKTLKELFDCVEKYCARRKIKGTVIFDEFQEIGSIENGNTLEKEMRSAFQHHQNVSYAFLGSKVHLMNNLFRDKNRPFYNFGQKIELEPIDKKEWSVHIKNSFKNGGFGIDSKTIELINDISQGHPYYTQLLCSEIWEICRGKKSVTAKDIEKAFQRSLDMENHAFAELWDSLNLSQRKIVNVLSQDPEAALFSSEVVRKYNLGAPSSLHRTAEQLLKRGVLSRKNSRYSLTDPFLTKWMRRMSAVK